jgi:hypothetical protein
MTELIREELDAQLGTIASRMDACFAQADATLERKITELIKLAPPTRPVSR